MAKTEVMRTDDVGETTSEELDKGNTSGLSPRLIKKTIRQDIYYWPDGMAYALPKVHEAQWIRQGMSKTPPPAPDRVYVQCELCEKQITAGENIKPHLLKDPKLADNAKKAARLAHIMSKHAGSAIVVLDDAEFDKAMKLIR